MRILLLFLLLSCSLNYNENGIPIYFVGGQSNANIIFYETIRNYILSIESEAIIIHNNHPGCPIEYWYNAGSSKKNYIEDITKIKQEIDSNEYNFKGLFWWQGESDRSKIRYEKYHIRFRHLIEQFKKDLDPNFNIYMIIVSAEIDNDMMDGIREVQQRIVRNNNNIYSIDSYGHPKLNWNTSHMEEQEYIEIGNEISELWFEIQNENE